METDIEQLYSYFDRFLTIHIPKNPYNKVSEQLSHKKNQSALL